MDVKLKDVQADDTSITIGKSAGKCVEYEINSGTEDIFSSPEYDRSKAYAGWKTACADWKTSMREINKENRVISLNCGSPTRTQDGDQHIYRSSGTYKIRVQMKERQ